MKAARGDLLLTIALLGLAGGFLAGLTELGRLARLVPTSVALLTLLLLLMQLVSHVRRRTDGAVSAAAVEEPSDGWRAPAARPMSALLWVFSVPLLVLVFGMTPGIGFFALSYLRFGARLGWLPSMSMAVALSASLHLLVERALGLTLHGGLVL